ncbi:MAG: hypothetical protein JNL73_11725 [Anaerolineales bacterium]|nr:hypothetical protein [Anaerolineales bacterium]
MQRLSTTTLVLLGSAVWLGLAPIGRAQSALTITSDTLTADLPDTLTFALQADNAARITDVQLNYGVNARSCQEGAASQAPEFTPGTAIEASWTLDLRDTGSFPVGAELWWNWEVSDDAGAVTTTERRTQRLEDERFSWRTTTRGAVTVAWHQGDQAFGEALAAIAASSLTRITRDAGLELADPIRIYVYPDPAEIAQVILFQPEWVGGLAFPEHNIVMAAIAPGEDAWAREVLPHELMHLVSGALTFNCLGARMPTWLSEGLSRFAEDNVDPALAAQVREMALAGTLPHLSALANAFSAYGGEARVSYEQSLQVVAFLIETHGAEKMSALLDAIAAGTAIDAALTRVYGLTTYTLDSAWRESFGAPTREAAVATPLTVPTLALWTAVARSSSTPAPSDTPLPGVTETPAPVIESTPRPVESPTAAAPGGGLAPCGAGAAALVVVSGALRRRRVGA